MKYCIIIALLITHLLVVDCLSNKPPPRLPTEFISRVNRVEKYQNSAPIHSNILTWWDTHGKRIRMNTKIGDEHRSHIRLFNKVGHVVVRYY